MIDLGAGFGLAALFVASMRGGKRLFLACETLDAKFTKA